MTEQTNDIPAAGEATAGMLLRKAREKQGMHIAVLAATIKVSPRKLELLESDRYDELPDATFTRALAQTVCRTLKVDAAPVLALLPQPGNHRLEQVSEGINAPFRDRGRQAPAGDWSALWRPGVVVPVVVIAAAALVYLLPAGTLAPVAGLAPPLGAGSAPSAAPQAPAASFVASGAAAASAAAASAPEVAASAPPPEPITPPAPPPARTLQFRAAAPSWVEVIDGRGQPLISRTVAAGEVVDLDGALPLRVRIGNAAATQLAFRGKAVELGAYTRENVARLDLK